MCTTPYCFGDCEDCLREEKQRKRDEELYTSCPHNVKCKLVTVDVKTDRCTTCGRMFHY